MAKTESISDGRLRAILGTTEAPATLNEIDDMAEELLERRAANSDGGVEPVAWRFCTTDIDGYQWPWEYTENKTKAEDRFSRNFIIEPLYAHPPAKALDGIAVKTVYVAVDHTGCIHSCEDEERTIEIAKANEASVKRLPIAVTDEMVERAMKAWSGAERSHYTAAMRAALTAALK